MIKVGEEPDSMTKTDADGGILAPREAALHIPRSSQRIGTRSEPHAVALRPEGATQRRSPGRCSREDSSGAVVGSSYRGTIARRGDVATTR